jgi:hypothetical protein
MGAMNKRNIGVVGVLYLAAAVFVFCLAPTGKTGMLSGSLTNVFDSVVVPTAAQGDRISIYGGTQTVGSSDRFGVCYRLVEGTTTAHIQLRYAVSFDDPLSTDTAGAGNWINGDVDIESDYTTAATWKYAVIPSTNTVAPWIRFEATGVDSNATDTAVQLKFFKQ